METGTDSSDGQGVAVYRHVTAIEPLMPSDSALLRSLAVDLLREAGALSSAAKPETRAALARTLRITNSYYSQLIEGHYTNPVDIERAVSGDFSNDPAKRNLQRENLAHIEAQQELEARLIDPAFQPAAPDSICWLHKVFYDRLPQDMWQVKTRSGGLAPITPGALRTGLVEVGTHVAPAPEIVPAMLARLDEGCRAADGLDQIFAIAAMHHRLLWVHPFDDGNGRVARLVSHAQIVRAGLDAGGLWSISRGLARHRDQYRNALAAADSQRQGSTDGRGNLSARALGDFCEFFLSTMLDQIRFMRECLNFESFADRLHKHVLLSGTFGRHGELVWLLLREAWARGSFTRGDAARITNTSERMARNLLRMALDAGLLASSTARGPVHLAFPVEFAESVFPRLYAPGGW